MELSHEYNEYVVGLVVTDKETNRSVNFQYAQFQPTNHPEPNYYLQHSCEGDDTASVFTEFELEKISEYVNNLPNSETLEEEFTAVMHSHLIKHFKSLHAEQGCIYQSDILNYFEMIDYVYVISVNGSLTEYNYFETEEEAQAEIDDMDDEDAYLCKICRMSVEEFHAYSIIEEYAPSNEQHIEILKAFDASMHSESKQFVSENLAKLGLTNDLNKAYFKYLIKAVYSISDGATWNCSDEPSGHYIEPLAYEAFATQYIENLISDTFEKKINLAELVK